jgi:hypothetical protein
MDEMARRTARREARQKTYAKTLIGKSDDHRCIRYTVDDVWRESADCSKDSENFIVVGSNWGMDRAPAWLLNLTENPDAKEVTIAQTDYSVRAEFPQGEEGEHCWNLLVEIVPHLPKVAKDANRTLPIVKLVRT